MATYITDNGEIIDERKIMRVLHPDVGIPAYYANGYIRSYVQQWRSRLFLEWYGCDHRERCLFVTLTYDDKKCVNGVAPTHPVKEHIQLFMKRLRSYYDYGYTFVGAERRKVNLIPPKKGIRYFFVHEQGDQNGRLHYHGVIYGIGYNWNEYLVMEKAWQMGHVRTAKLTAGRINYCIKYLSKNYAKSMRRVMSKGIGESFLTISRREDIRNKFINFGTLNVHINGWSYPITRYFREKIWCAVDWTYLPGRFCFKLNTKTMEHEIFTPKVCRPLPAFGIYMKREYREKRNQIVDKMAKKKQENPPKLTDLYKVMYPIPDKEDMFLVTNLTVDERRRIEKINKTVKELNEIYNG